MDPGNIFAGSAFRTAALAATLFTGILLFIGVSTYHLMANLFEEELKLVLVDEMTLLRRSHEEGGHNLLIAAVRKLEMPAVAGERLASVFDQTGIKLAGNMTINPSAISLNREVAIIHDAIKGEIFVHSAWIETKQIVVGRNVELLEQRQLGMIRNLILAGLSALLGCLGIGWTLSFRSMKKLQRVAITLNHVAHGDFEARINAGKGKGQIDSISRLIDQSLEQLSSLVNSAQNTSQAIAHDLRSPLNRALIAVRKAEETETGTVLVDVEKSLIELNDIFDTVLRISRLRASRDRSAFVSLDLNELVLAVVDVFESELEGKKQSVFIASHSRPVTIVADAQMIKQLLSNLLQNFHRYTPAGARVEITAETNPDGSVSLTVADNGPGIPEDTLDEVMEPFYRLDASRTNEGSGLGLALVKAIVLRHDATFTLSNNNPGLLVEIRFPPPQF